MTGPRDQYPGDRRAEDRLRDALHAYAETVDPAPGAWHRLSDRLAPRSWRAPRALLAAAGAAAVVAAAVVAVVLVAGRDGGRDVEVGPADTAPQPSAPEPTSPPPTSNPPTTAPGATYDDGIAAAVADGRVVMLAPDGTEVRELAPAREGRQVMQVEVAANRASVWFLSKPAGQATACGEVLTVPPLGGDPVDTGFRAAAFALSPDGARVALALRGDDPEGCTDGETLDSLVVVRDVGTGDEVARWTNAHPEGTTPELARALAWSPDGVRLAAALCWENCGVAVLDPSAPGTFADAVRLDAGANDVDFPAWSRDRLVVHEWCCYPDYGDGSRVVAYDPATGARGDVLADLGDAPLRDLAADATADRYTVVLSENTLERLEPPAASATVAGDVLAADWAPGLGAGTGDTAPAACSAAGVEWAHEEPALPAPVEATRRAVADAAVACDWDALRALMAGEFSYSFGGDPDADAAVAAWQEQERSGEPVLRTLVERLAAAPAERDGIFTFADPADELAYRAGIRADGTWIFFVAGD